MSVVVVEGTETIVLNMSLQELMGYITFAKKERERHRQKAVRAYQRRKQKALEEDLTPATLGVEA